MTMEEPEVGDVLFSEREGKWLCVTAVDTDDFGNVFAASTLDVDAAVRNLLRLQQPLAIGPSVEHAMRAYAATHEAGELVSVREEWTRAGGTLPGFSHGFVAPQGAMWGWSCRDGADRLCMAFGYYAPAGSVLTAWQSAKD